MARKKKGKIVKIVVIIAIVGGLAYLAIYKSPLSPSPSAVELGVPESITPAEETVSVTTKEGEISENTAAYTIDATYPKVAGLSESVNDAINADIAKKVVASIEAFKDNLASFPEQDPSLYADDKSTFATVYEVFGPAHGILGIELDISQYSSGAAHPNNFALTQSYDVGTGASIGLSTIFKSGAAYLPALAQIATEKLEGRFGANWFKEGVEPVADNYQNFYVGENELTIVFNSYQVASYASGIVTIDIALSDIADLLNPKYFGN